MDSRIQLRSNINQPGVQRHAHLQVDFEKVREADKLSPDLYISNGDGQREVDKAKFAEKYVARSKAALAQVGKRLELGTSPETFSSDRQAQLALGQAAVALTGALGPAVALKIGADINREALPKTETGREELDSTFIPLASQSEERLDGAVVKYVTGLSGSYVSGAGAGTSGTAFVDINTAPRSTAHADFVVGHELSHVRHRDALDGGGQSEVLSAVADFAQAEASEGSANSGSTFAVHKKLLETSHQLDLIKEYRCDYDGFRYAVSKGHSPEAVLGGMKKELSNHETDKICSGGYPGQYWRIQVAEEYMHTNPPAPVSWDPTQASQFH